MTDVHVRVEIKNGEGRFTLKPAGLVAEIINYDKPENYVLLEMFEAIKNGGGDYACQNFRA